MNLASRIEGILFFKSEPQSISELVGLLGVTDAEIEEALVVLTTQLTDRGVVLVRAEDTAGLMTAPELAPIIESIKREELKRDIGKAGAETLAIIAYHENVTRAEIDYIRGVNSTFILRNLLIRGLIERIQNPHDQRSFAYRPTLELYAHLGVTKKEDLPQYHEMKEAIEAYKMEARGDTAGDKISEPLTP